MSLSSYCWNALQRNVWKCFEKKMCHIPCFWLYCFILAFCNRKKLLPITPKEQFPKCVACKMAPFLSKSWRTGIVVFPHCIIRLCVSIKLSLLLANHHFYRSQRCAFCVAKERAANGSMCEWAGSGSCQWPSASSKLDERCRNPRLRVSLPGDLQSWKQNIQSSHHGWR